MEMTGRYLVKDSDPDYYGEVCTFIHTKYPAWRFVVEPMIPFRDARGLSRGHVNQETALTIAFRNKMFQTNSIRVIEKLRDMGPYLGKKGPNIIQEVIASGRKGGFFEVDKEEEAIYQRRAEFESMARKEAQDRLAAEKQAEMLKHHSIADEEEVIESYEEYPAEEALTCPNCGTEGYGKFCSECGTSYEVKSKRTWICDICGDEFSSGFKLGDHKRTYHKPKKKELNIPPTGPQMISGGHGTDNIGPGAGLL